MRSIKYGVLGLALLSCMLGACVNEADDYQLTLSSQLVNRVERWDAPTVASELSAFQAANGGATPAAIFQDPTRWRVDENGQRVVQFRLRAGDPLLTVRRTANGLEIGPETLHLPIAVRELPDGRGYDFYQASDRVTLEPRARVTVEPAEADVAALLALQALDSGLRSARLPVQDGSRVIPVVPILAGLSLLGTLIFCTTWFPDHCRDFAVETCGRGRMAHGEPYCGAGQRMNGTWYVGTDCEVDCQPL